ncbi:PiggyBac transposable element-derived protein 4 [Araneus ventricosus]|uniref:PiggyBac transposable element-derived protein 4 n=1 Tax=Araneus ventricosus TaxID=182803 RepID=A0A4Y2FG28_ARAVE|nr:PiggyBac transposable element-derived protein 4 [Araneus ventricosus]
MPQKYLTQMEIENVMKDLDAENYDDSDSDCEEELENSILKVNNEVNLDTSANFVENVESLFSWKDVEGSEAKNVLPFLGKVGLKFDNSNYKNEYDFFKLLFTDEILSVLVKETNRYASDIMNIHGETSDKRKHAPEWKPTDNNEILKFLGLVLLMGHIEKDSLQDYWTVNDLIEAPVFRKVMPHDRFLIIFKFLHFSDNSLKECRDSPTYDRLWKIRKIFECFNRAFKEVYDPTENLSLDEVIIKFKGRVLFQQYIPKKRKQWGIKMYKISDATGYTYNMRVYLGKDKLKENLSPSASYNVVYTMAECVKDKGHKLFMDNFFSSPKLFHDLLTEKKINSCGTIRSNRKYFPKDLAPKKMKQGDVAAKFCNGMTALCWKDKRHMYMLTNMHSPKNEFVVEERKRCKRKFEDEVVECGIKKLTTKPKIVADYNKHMGYVDLGDRMASTYTFTQRTRKWTKKLFFSLIDIAVLNAFLMFKSNQTKSNFSLKEFRMNLITSLIGNINSKVAEPSVTPKLKSNDDTKFSHWAIDEKKRSRCTCCAKKDKQKITTIICKACNVALCIDQNCFEEYHTIYLKMI